MRIDGLIKYLENMPSIPNYHVSDTMWKYVTSGMFERRGCMSFVKSQSIQGGIMIKPPATAYKEYPFSEYQFNRFIASIKRFSPLLANLESDYETMITVLPQEMPPMLRYFVMLNMRAAWENPKYVYIFNYLTSNRFTATECMWILSMSRYIWTGSSMWEFTPCFSIQAAKGSFEAYETTLTRDVSTPVDNAISFLHNNGVWGNNPDGSEHRPHVTSPFYQAKSGDFKLFKKHKAIREWLALYKEDAK